MRYKTKPNTPDCLNSNGKPFWDLYTTYFLDRNYLHSEHVPAIESLCFMEQQRVEMQKEIKENGRNEDRMKELNKMITQIRLQKNELGIYPRKNEFHKPETEEEKKQKEEANKDPKIHQLTKTW